MLFFIRQKSFEGEEWGEATLKIYFTFVKTKQHANWQQNQTVLFHFLGPCTLWMNATHLKNKMAKFQLHVAETRIFLIHFRCMQTLSASTLVAYCKHLAKIMQYRAAKHTLYWKSTSLAQIYHHATQ